MKTKDRNRFLLKRQLRQYPRQNIANVNWIELTIKQNQQQLENHTNHMMYTEQIFINQNNKTTIYNTKAKETQVSLAGWWLLSYRFRCCFCCCCFHKWLLLPFRLPLLSSFSYVVLAYWRFWFFIFSHSISWFACAKRFIRSGQADGLDILKKWRKTKCWFKSEWIHRLTRLKIDHRASYESEVTNLPL